MKLQWIFVPTLIATGATLPYLFHGLPQNATPPERRDNEQKIVRSTEDESPAKKKEEPQPVVKQQPEPKPTETGDFRLPDDLGGRLVLRIVAPTQTLSEPRRTEPVKRAAPRSIESPSVLPRTLVVSLPKLSEPGSGRVTQPEMVSAESFIALEELIGVLPETLVFPAQDRVKIPSPDVSIPIALPRSAQPLGDRAATTDPTLDISKSNILSAPLPTRTTPAPFQRLTLPDPFEYHDAVRGLTGPPDDTLPDANVKPPRK